MSAHNLPFQLNDAVFTPPFSLTAETRDGVYGKFYGVLDEAPSDNDTGWLKGAVVVALDTEETPGIFVNIGDVTDAEFVQTGSVEAGAAQAAVDPVTAVTASAEYDQTEVQSIADQAAAAAVLANALRTALINNGTIKGSA